VPITVNLVPEPDLEINLDLSKLTYQDWRILRKGEDMADEELEQILSKVIQGHDLEDLPLTAFVTIMEVITDKFEEMGNPVEDGKN
jgi:hypothetical protein